MRSASFSARDLLERRPHRHGRQAGIGQRLVAEQPRQLAHQLAELLGFGALIAQQRELVADRRVRRDVETCGRLRPCDAGRRVHHVRPPLGPDGRRIVPLPAPRGMLAGPLAAPVEPPAHPFRLCARQSSEAALSSPVTTRSAAASVAPATTSAPATRPAAAPVRRAARAATRPVPPVIVRQIRGRIVESEHRGHVVEADADGRVIRLIGDPDRIVALRSCVKPFTLVALIEAGGQEAYDLSPAEIALLASSHSGEDLHVRTLQGVFRRAGLTQTMLACGTDGAPLDGLTSARLARDGERPSPIRHMCSGQHAAALLLSRLRGWPLETYWQDDHPAQIEARLAVARCFGVAPDRLASAIDGCGIPTFGLRLKEVARAYAFLANPAALPMSDPRASVAPSLSVVRDSMVGQPGAGRGDARPARHVADEGRAGRDREQGRPGGPARDRDPAAARAGERADRSRRQDRGWRRARARRRGRRRSRRWRRQVCSTGSRCGCWRAITGPSMLDPHGRQAAEAIAEFELAPVGELSG